MSSFGSMPKEKVIYPNLPTVTDEFEVFDEALYKAMEKNEIGDVFYYYKDGVFFKCGKGKQALSINIILLILFFIYIKVFILQIKYIKRKRH